MAAVDRRQLLELGLREARLRAVEARGGGTRRRAARTRPRTVSTSPFASGRTSDRQAVREVESAGLHGQLEKPTLEGWKSQPSVAQWSSMSAPAPPRLHDRRLARGARREVVAARRPRALARRPPLRRDPAEHRRAARHPHEPAAPARVGGRRREAAVPGAPAAVRVPADRGGRRAAADPARASPSGATAGRRATHATWLHECGAELDLMHTCDACGGEVTGLDLHRRRQIGRPHPPS